MQHPTSHYEKLKKSLAHLNPLIRGVNLIECKTILQDLKVQSYIFHTHSIFEQYLENLVLEAALEARQRYSRDGVITLALIGLVSAGVLEEITKGSAKKKISQKIFSNLELFSTSAHSTFIRLVAENHGIKKENLKSLMLPVGVDPEETDLPTMAALDAFGVKRGGIAHQFKINKEHTLSETKNGIRQIVTGMKNYDMAVCQSLNVGMTTQ